ncbi:MAG: hypothetical protein ACRDHM_04850 [Actinomycetota bacterium]
MEEQAYEKVIVVVDRPGREQVNLGKGRLVARDGGLEFQSKKGALSMRPVRSVKRVGAGVRVEFGEGSEVFTAIATDWSKGIFGIRSRTRAMGDALQAVLHTKEITEVETQKRQGIEREEAKVGMRKAKTQMWIFGLITLVGTIATLVSVSSSSDGGGTYYVFWGAIVFGLGGVLEAYFDRYRKYRKVLEGASEATPQAGAST